MELRRLGETVGYGHFQITNDLFSQFATGCFKKMGISTQTGTSLGMARIGESGLPEQALKQLA